MPDRAFGQPTAPTTSTIRADGWDPDASIDGRAFDAVLFTGLDLSEGIERGARFTDCTFRTVRLHASTHRDAAFLNCTFIDCSFFDVSFIGCKLVGTMFDRCRFGPTTVEGGDWSLVGLPGADLRQVTFRALRMREADLTGARLDETVLRDVDLAGAWLHEASFQGTDLRGSDLTSLDPIHAEIGGAQIDVEQALVIATTLGLRIG